MNDHEKAARWGDLHEHRLQLLGEITEAQAEVDRVDGEKELKNLAVFETIRTAADGVTEIWKDGRCARVRETQAQIWAKIQEASK